MTQQTEKTHTKGPWHRNIRANGKYPVVFAGRNQHVATVSQQADGDQTEANIDLIAAAPELLVVLEFIAEHYRGWPNKPKPHYLKYVKAAIAKARGQS